VRTGPAQNREKKGCACRGEREAALLSQSGNNNRLGVRKFGRERASFSVKVTSVSFLYASEKGETERIFFFTKEHILNSCKDEWKIQRSTSLKEPNKRIK
jgi:hypothetical protein